METFLNILYIVGVIGFFIFIAVINFYDRDKSAEKSVEKGENDTNNNVYSEENMRNERIEKVQTKEEMSVILNSIFKQIGCQPEVQEDGSYMVAYQGKHFHFMFNNLYVRIWMPFWHRISENDPELNILKDAVNITNFETVPCTVLTAADEEGFRYLHTKTDIVLHSSIPGRHHYVHMILDSFFETMDIFRTTMCKIKSQQESTPQHPIGFTPDMTPSEN